MPPGQLIGVHWLSVQPAPLQRHDEPPLQPIVHATAVEQSMSQVDLPEQVILTESPACTVTPQVLPIEQLALHVLPAWQTKSQLHAALAQVNPQLMPALQDSAQQGVQLVAQLAEQAVAASEVRSAGGVAAS
jgi:hypothetical protein